MKVWDNLAEFEKGVLINSGVSKEEKWYLHDTVAKAIQHLIDMRKSEEMTSHYFFTSLTTDERKNDYIRRLEENKDVEHTSYQGYPTEWNLSDEMGRHILDYVIKDDKVSFGYLYKLLCKVMRGDEIEGYSDAAICYAIDFDIDEVKKEMQSIPAYNKRRNYLIDKRTESDLILCSEDDITLAKLKENFGQMINALIKGEDDKRYDGESVDDKPLKAEAEKNHNVYGDILYDLSILKEDEFKNIEIPVSDGWDRYEERNKAAFSAILDYMFAHCYDTTNGLRKNETLFRFVQEFMGKLLDSLYDNLKIRIDVVERDCIRKFADWILTTKELVNAAYESTPILYLANDAEYVGDGFDDDFSQETLPFKLAIMKDAWGLTQFFVNELRPLLSDRLNGEVPYNLWGEDFAVLSQKYTGKFGLEFEKRAVVDMEDNAKLFIRTLDNHFLEYSTKMDVEEDFGNPASIFNEFYHKIDDLFHSMFRDYLERIQRLTTDKQELDDAMLNWLVSLQYDIDEHYMEYGPTLERKISGGFRADVKCFTFMRDICSTIAYEMTATYFKDFENKDISRRHGLDLVVGSQEEKPVDAPNTHVRPQHQSSAQKTSGQPKAHNRTIDFDKLYNAWNNIAFVNTSLEEFIHAIDYADFKNMLKIAKDVGEKMGYIGCVKFIIKSLRIPLGVKWYSAACASIGETNENVGKLNEETKKIKKMDKSVINECIK